MLERLKSEAAAAGAGREFVVLRPGDHPVGSLIREHLLEMIVEPINGGAHVVVYMRFRPTAKCLACLHEFLKLEFVRAIGPRLARLELEDHAGRAVKPHASPCMN